MSIQTLTSKISLDLLANELFYTLIRVRANSATTKFVTAFETLWGDFKKIKETELTLREKIANADALIDACDDDLDDLVDALNSTLLMLTQNHRSDPLYQRYFGAKRASDLKKPVLGEELEIVRSWLDSLKASTHKELQDLSKKFEEVVKSSDAAIAASRDARAKYADFRTTGDRQKFFHRVNAERKSLYGELGKLSHAASSMNAVNFADRFFLHQQAPKRTLAFEPLDQIDAQIEEAEGVVVQLREKRAAAQAHEEQVAHEQAQREATLKALVEAEKAAFEAAKNVAELKDKLGKK